VLRCSAVSGEDAQDRSDRTILTPWVKFLWESYCQCLELLRTNAHVETLYHDIARMVSCTVSRQLTWQVMLCSSTVSRPGIRRGKHGHKVCLKSWDVFKRSERLIL
jgi:hypothetical protein